MARATSRSPKGRQGTRKGPASIQRAEVKGHVVEVRDVPDTGEGLWIDGQRREFFVTNAGYHLLDAAYSPAEETLLAAATKYLERITGAGDAEPS